MKAAVFRKPGHISVGNVEDAKIQASEGIIV